MSRFVEFTDPDGEPVWVNRHRVLMVTADPDDRRITRLWLGGSSMQPVRGKPAQCLERLEERDDD